MSCYDALDARRLCDVAGKPNPALCYIRSSCRNLIYQCMHLGYQLGDFEWLGDNVVLVVSLARRKSRVVGRRWILPFLLLVPWWFARYAHWPWPVICLSVWCPRGIDSTHRNYRHWPCKLALFLPFSDPSNAGQPIHYRHLKVHENYWEWCCIWTTALCECGLL